MQLKKFVDPLPSLKRVKPTQKTKRGDYYEVQMEQFKHKVHRDLPSTMVWGYNRQFPGPLFDVDQGEPTHVKWINNLPDKHLLPVDKSIHDVAELPEVRTVTHLHGSETKSASDGYPEAWYTRNYQDVGPFFKRKVYTYPNRQRAAALWYHDHAMGITRLNMYAGLAGMYLIRDNQEKALPLPKRDYEIPLIIQDRTFAKDGSLVYPKQPDNPAGKLPNPSHHFFLEKALSLMERSGLIWKSNRENIAFVS